MWEPTKIEKKKIYELLNLGNFHQPTLVELGQRMSFGCYFILFYFSFYLKINIFKFQNKYILLILFYASHSLKKTIVKFKNRKIYESNHLQIKFNFRYKMRNKKKAQIYISRK